MVLRQAGAGPGDHMRYETAVGGAVVAGSRSARPERDGDSGAVRVEVGGPKEGFHECLMC